MRASPLLRSEQPAASRVSTPANAQGSPPNLALQPQQAVRTPSRIKTGQVGSSNRKPANQTINAVLGVGQVYATPLCKVKLQSLCDLCCGNDSCCCTAGLLLSTASQCPADCQSHQVTAGKADAGTRTEWSPKPPEPRNPAQPAVRCQNRQRRESSSEEKVSNCVQDPRSCRCSFRFCCKEDGGSWPEAQQAVSQHPGSAAPQAELRERGPAPEGTQHPL